MLKLKSFSSDLAAVHEARGSSANNMSMKWMRGYGGTRFVWNLVMSTLSTPSERSDAVSDADRVDAAHVAERAVVQHRRTTQTCNKSYSAKKARLRFFVFFNKRKPLRCHSFRFPGPFAH